MNGSIVELIAETDKKFAAYVAIPDKPSGHAVIVLQEIFGINANIRGIVDDYAYAGYIAIAPDLFWRQQPGVELDPAKPQDRETATKLMKGLDQPRAIDDALIAAAHARALPQFSGGIAAVGFCLGGKLAYMLSTRPEIRAAVSYYGVGIQSALDLAPRVQCDLLLHIAGRDHLCPPEAQAAIKSALAPLGQKVQIMDYPESGHAFARRGGENFDPEAAKKAGQATYSFLTEALSALH